MGERGVKLREVVAGSASCARERFHSKVFNSFFCGKMILADHASLSLPALPTTTFVPDGGGGHVVSMDKLCPTSTEPSLENPSSAEIKGADGRSTFGWNT